MTASFHGLLVIDKPAGMSSRDAVNRAQAWFPRGTRIGHTGTLDPLATGVLVLCVGVATRLAEFVQEQGKVYHTRIWLGARSDSDDAEGIITPVTTEPVPAERLPPVLAGLTGSIDQVPPAFSAVKVAGRRAYNLARRGQDVALKPRRVFVERIELVAYSFPWLELRISCGEGTYIRSLARDIGERLGCGGYVTMLRRLSVGRFRVEDAIALDADAKTTRSRLLPLAEALDMPRLTLDQPSISKLRQGQRVRVPDNPPTSQRFAVLDESGALAAVGQIEVGADGPVLRPVKVLSTIEQDV